MEPNTLSYADSQNKDKVEDVEKKKSYWTTSIYKSGDDLKCGFCKNKVFGTKLEIAKHLIENHVESNKYEVCQYCVKGNFF